MIKAIIFDLDGTLLNTLEDLTNSVNHTLMNFNYPTRTKAEIRSFLGNGAKQLIKQSLPEKTIDQEIEKILSFYKNYYSQHNMEQTKPYHNIIEMLRELKTKNIKLAIVSNKPDKDVKSLNNIFFKDYIDLAYGENEIAGIRKKPYPDAINKVLEEFKISSSEALYVGDSEVDIATANNAKMEGIICTWGFRDFEYLQKNGAKFLISNPFEILKFLL